MYTAIVENAKGERLELTHNPAFIVKSITGLNPPNATINTNANANFDGSTFNSSKLNERNIVITILPRGDVEQSRQLLYQYIKSKQFVRFYYRNRSRNVYIDGRVETFECDFFENPQQAQISIVCPSPYFMDVETKTNEISYILKGFTFPFCTNEGETFVFGTEIPFAKTSINNTSDVAIGAIIQFEFTGEVDTPKLYKEETGESIIVKGKFRRGDVVTINTIDGRKSVSLLRDGVTTNVINDFIGSNWIKLDTGNNTFLLDAANGRKRIVCTITSVNLYEGV